MLTGAPQVIVWGPMPHELPVQRRIARAELYAVLVMLRNAHPPFTLWVDCQLISPGGAHRPGGSTPTHGGQYGRAWAQLGLIGFDWACNN